MKKYSNFLHTEVYRRTFVAYLSIVLVFLATILSFMYRDIYQTSQENFLQEASRTCEELDRQAADVAASIDQFAAQVYSTPGLSEDFFRFFGSTAEEYTSQRLAQPAEPQVSILTSLKSLVLSSGNAIRHILCYAPEHIVDLEFNDQGDSRHRLITSEEADRICGQGCVYQKDVHRDSAYLGKISIVLDLTRFLREPDGGAQGRGLCFLLPERVISTGDLRITEERAEQILHAGNLPKRISTEQGTIYATAYSSPSLPFTMLYLTSAEVLLRSMLCNFAIITLGMLAAFGAISLVLIRLFSRDTNYISAILHSMELAEQEIFTPVPLTGYSPEYDSIIRGLNDLYAHLESLIHREYKLTISQQKAQMEMLSTQLSPHFLYNTLERIRMRAVLDGNQDVAQATAGLGLLYRNIVKTEPVIPLSRELEITEQYLELMSFLYGDELLYYFDVDESLKTMQTPKIWMQPIVENFFKHNFRQDSTIKVIVVELRRLDGGFEGRFFDNIGHLEPERMQQINDSLRTDCGDGQGIGLQNVLHRLQLFYGSNLRITMENNDPAGICMHVIYEKEGTEHVSTADCGR